MWLVALALACEPVPPRSLDDVDLPAGFTLDTHREARVHVRLDPAAATSKVFVSILTPGGVPLFEGPVDAAADVPARVPPTVDAVVVVARAPWGETRQRVPLDDGGEVTVTVGGAP